MASSKGDAYNKHFRGLGDVETVVKKDAVTYDAETVAHALAQQITITGIVGSQLLRTLLVLTGKILSNGENRAGNKHASGH